MTVVRSLAFGPCEIQYDTRVLEPRPWTLLQSTWAAELAADTPDGPILELCSGAGQIGLVAAVLSGRPLVQVDLDPVACGYARMNASRAGVSDSVDVRCGSMETEVRADERFHLVLADPPYVPTSQLDDHPDDPLLAIDGGGHGLDLPHRCLEVIAEVLHPGGSALLQLRGASQVEQLVSSTGALSDGTLTIAELREEDRFRAVALVRRGVNDSRAG
jgi:release factor glutamine methyltransferase